MTLKDGKKLDNILSVSTAASNKYLFHFDSYHALSQWTAGIRLAMYEHTTLSEAYTGALIAGKGKTLNNIRTILDRQCAVYDDWVRVRFGAGTPWRRCWCVVSPPDQKEYQKLQKTAKKNNVYDRTPVILKGDIKFYDSKKITKKSRPIATVKDAYSCYAIYPQSKALIDSSTLVKIEGKITVHSNPESTTEGFVFIMPEARPAVTGFEIMLQYLFPVFDTFNLYGRPKKLVADVLDPRGLMFAMPSDKRYGFLEIWDVVGLINTDGSQHWSERQWRKQLKELTSTRMAALGDDIYSSARNSRRNTMSRSGFSGSKSNLRFDERGSIRSNPSTRQSSPSRRSRVEFDGVGPPRRVGTAPAAGPFQPPGHSRSVSEANGYNRYQPPTSRFANDQGMAMEDRAPTPPPHGQFNVPPSGQQHYQGSDSDESPVHEPQNLPQLPVGPSAPPVGPVDLPPAQEHGPYQQPPVRPALPPAMKPNAAVDSATLHQMADATNTPLPAGIAAAGAAAAWKSQESLQSRRSGEYNAYGDNNQQMHLNARPSPNERNSNQRLPTIPASPYVEHAEFVDHHNAYQPMAPPVPEHTELPRHEYTEDLPHRPHPGSGSDQVQRKPVPGRSPSATSREGITRSTTSSSLDSSRQDMIDPIVLLSLQDRLDDDAVSTSTPDYSSVYSDDLEPQPRPLPERREDRPRSGILRVVGDPNIKPKSDTEAGASNIQSDLPSVDFGPTYHLNFDEKRPGTSGTVTQAAHDRSRSRDGLIHSPSEQPRQAYPSGRTTPDAATHLRSGSGSNSPQINDSRSVAWRPGTSMSQQLDKQKLNPEEWVMHRASQQPQTMTYGHGRAKSHTPPPFGRQPSGDWTHLQQTPEGSSGSNRPPSRPLSRPQSRGADVLLEQRSANLSAREQEQVARMTNTPLLDMSRDSGHKQRQPSVGLTGYIDFREKEKAAAKANRQGHSTVMQAEIDRRTLQEQKRQMMEVQQRQRQMLEMQQQQLNQQMAMAQSNYAPSMYGAPSVMGMQSGTPSVMGMPTGPGTPSGMIGMAYSTPTGMPQMYQQGYFQQPVMTPNTNMLPGGWASPSPQTPQQQYVQQQQQQMYGQQQQFPPTQAYGASFDAQQAAKYSQQQGQFRR